MAMMWGTRDPFGRDIALTDDGWDHIVLERRGKAPRPAEIREAVEAPDFVNAGADVASRENFYRRGGTDRPYLKVVVHYRPVPPQGSWAGEVVTAYVTKRVKREEQPLWP